MKASEYMPTDMQYKDGLRKDKIINDLIIETLKEGNVEKALEYLEANNARIEKALEDWIWLIPGMILPTFFN